MAPHRAPTYPRLSGTSPIYVLFLLSDFTYSFLYRMFKKSGKDSFRISSLRRQSGTHVILSTLRILLASAPRTARLSLSSFLNEHLYTKREYSSYRKDGYSRGATLIRYKCNALCRIKI